MKKLAALLAFVMCCTVAFAQNSVQGTVKDNTGETVIGATVQIKGGSTGVITDIDGKYTISGVLPSDVLVFSFLGYTSQEVKVGNQKVINVTLMEDAKDLEEVVLVGYGVQKKSDLTGSVGSVSMEKMLQKGSPNLLETMQGSVPGVTITQSTGRVGEGFSIEIRGKSSHDKDTKPLYIVDGVMCDDIDFLNPADIAQIDILKDASSTAIYGSRATAGVVMIATKSGASIAGKGAKPSISYDGYYGITEMARMPALMTAEEFYRYRFLKFLGYAEGGSPTALSGRPAYGMAAFEQMSLWNTDRGVSVLKEMIANGESYDWMGLVNQTGMMQNHYVSVGGSSQDVNYHMGVGYTDETGVTMGDAMSRISFKGSVDAKVNKWMKAGFNINLSMNHRDYANDNAVQNAYRANPFMKPYAADGSLNKNPGNSVSMGSSSGYQFSDQTSPLLYMENQTKMSDSYRMLGNVYLQATPMKGLTLKTVFQPSYRQWRLGQFDDTIVDNENSTARYNVSQSFGWVWDNILTYDRTFNQNHRVNFTAITSMESNRSESANLYYQNVMAGTYWWNLATGTYLAEDSKNSYSENSMMSYALRANYTYAGKYMLTATVRWDGSSKFAPGYRWGSFPSAAVAWRVSEEDFLKGYDWLSNLKLRVSYGVTGNNAGVANYATQQTVGGPDYYYFGGAWQQAFYPSGVVDTSLSWESSREINTGLDFGFFKNRISGSIDWYNKTAYDLLFDVKLPLEAGSNGSSPKEMATNVGVVNNRGIEFALSTVNVETKNWRWETSFTFAKNKNTLLDINGTADELPADLLFKGHPINVLYNYEWDGIISDRDMVVPDHEIAKLKGLTPGTTMKEYDYYYICYGQTEGQPKIVDRDGNGSYDTVDKKLYNRDPDWVGSFNTSLNYKNWDLSASVYVRQGGYASSAFMSEYLNYGDRGRTKLQVDHYIPAGTLIDCDGVNPDGTYINPVYQETTHYGSYPFPNNGAANSGIGVSMDYWPRAISEVSYVKVKNITLGYTLPKNLLKKVGIERLRLYSTVTNPFVFTDFIGFDPEWAGASLKQDAPSTITWQFGANLKF
ncbi:MAG: TonB-dependent receptor [Bacteroidales bacterium]|nr:TonB-dependent receptor [Bacteroidales bacterium]